MKVSGRFRFVVMIALMSACPIQQVSAAVLDAADAAGIRKFQGSLPFLLSFLAVKTAGDLEDRTILEFDLAALPPEALQPLELLVPILNFDEPGGAPTTIDVFTFISDGVVHPSDFDVGKHFAGLATGNVALEDLSLDVTPAVRNAIADGGRFLGFRLSTAGPDRYFLGKAFGLRDPLLTFSVPEPSTWAMMLAAFVGVGLARLRARRTPPPDAPPQRSPSAYPPPTRSIRLERT